MLYTDGLVESRSLPIEIGMKRLAQTVGKIGPIAPEVVCDALITALDSDSPLQDDVAVMAVRLD